jgi:hypothetical protein
VERVEMAVNLKTAAAQAANSSADAREGAAQEGP